MDKLRWGVLSTAKIGVEKVIPAMQAGQRCSVVAIASRIVATAQAAADKLGIPKAYGSYEKLLSDPDIDAVYIPLPNHLHVQWSIASLKAGKHVLCEKPIGLYVAEAERLLAAAGQHPRLKIMEAFMYRHHPQWRLAQQLVQNGEIGAANDPIVLLVPQHESDEYPQHRRSWWGRTDGYRLLLHFAFSVSIRG